MSTPPNIQSAIAQAAGYVQATWQQAVMGTQIVPGMREITQNVGLRQLYANNIVLSEQLQGGSNISQRVLAIKKIAQDLENGTGPWDMKPMLLGGPKARMGKNGKYNIIPFRHGTSSGYSPNNNFPTMPKDVYKQARELKASVKSGNGIKWGGRLTGTEGKYAPGHNPTSGYQHKNGKYEGMVRVEKTYAKATQSKYLTFRIVSEHSAPGSWIHPGYKAHHIASSVEAFCRPAVESMIMAAANADLQNAVINMGVI
jgi:hypothetical protein